MTFLQTNRFEVARPAFPQPLGGQLPAGGKVRSPSRYPTQGAVGHEPWIARRHACAFDRSEDVETPAGRDRKIPRVWRKDRGRLLEQDPSAQAVEHKIHFAPLDEFIVGRFSTSYTNSSWCLI